MASCITAHEKLQKDGEKLYDILKNNPNDYEAIQNQYENIIGEQQAYNAVLERAYDCLQGKVTILKHIKDKEIDLKKKAIDLDVENKGLQALLIFPDPNNQEKPNKEKKNAKKRIITGSKKIS